MLRPEGVYALNVIDQPPLKLLRAEMATLLETFGDVALVAGGGTRGAEDAGENLGGGNFILLASETQVPDAALRMSRGARTLGRDALEEFAAGADPLRDLDAPADQLISR